MAYKYIGDAELGVGLTVTTPKPLDSRLVIQDLKDLYELPESTAYQGMSVSCIQDGNIYMLIDKMKMHDKSGWKASYESLLIITCSLAEYDKWAANTTPEFTPKVETEGYLYPNTYYYTYDLNDTSQLYLTREWGMDIEDSIKTKAGISDVRIVLESLDNYKEEIANSYLNTEQIKAAYVPLTSINLEDPKSFISTTLAKYYTIIDADKKFVTRAELLDGAGGDQGFQFISKTDYIKDRNLDAESFTSKALKSETVTLTDLTLAPFILKVTNSNLTLNDLPIALKESVPVIVCLPENEYNSLETKDNNTYYYTYNPDGGKTDGYVTMLVLESTYCKKTEISLKLGLLEAKIAELEAKINELTTLKV